MPTKRHANKLLLHGTNIVASIVGLFPSSATTFTNHNWVVQLNNKRYSGENPPIICLSGD
ncbi:hypothetical protein T01_1303 [Trichinella spiralis]|uniref:Uncharacterized protein n=1 Tax=Trichinella spiralis TaxID=6334 RepID=A0A0V1BHJ4_TRISP|nr:hypothetical protein T01_1303 [Trichinella spiralis]